MRVMARVRVRVVKVRTRAMVRVWVGKVHC